LGVSEHLTQATPTKGRGSVLRTIQSVHKEIYKEKEMIKFTKMSASGNDFIVIDNRKSQLQAAGYNLYSFIDMIKKVCARKVGVGADGVLLLEDSSKADFKMRIFNPDGGEVEMCGNGARCVALFAYRRSLIANRKKLKIETKAGVLETEVVSNDRVKIKMTDPTNSRLNSKLSVDGKEYKVHSINTGVPHIVLFVEDLEKTEVKEVGKEIRYHKEFAPEGTNVNFIKVRDENSIDIRTYERGVEDETLACGTGACASAIVSHLLGRTKTPTKMHTKSGSVLTVYFDSSNSKITNLYLEGDAAIIYQGELA
jgi:diaminopimelate epimerase